MSSGVNVSDECGLAYQDIKMKKNLRYVQFRISDDKKSIIVDKQEKKGNKDSDMAEFRDQLPTNDCRYAIYDYDIPSNDGVNRTQLIFMYWAPENASIKQKMIYSASKDALAKKVSDGTKPLQLNEKDDFNDDNLISTCNKKF